VDDQMDMEPHKSRLVKTYMKDGLTEEKADELIAMLGVQQGVEKGRL
jgi:hypothetical protein